MEREEYKRKRLEKYAKDREEGCFNIENFKQFFSKIVKDINTCNLDWKVNCTNEIKYNLDRYLTNEMFHKHFFDFYLKVERVGQSNICFKLNYKESFHSKSYELESCERLRTPSEVRILLLNTFQDAMIMKTIRDNGKQVNETKEPHICQGHKKPSAKGASGAVMFYVLKDTFKCTSKASIFENNKWFCKRHAPSKIKEREEKSWDNYIKKINNSKEN